MKVRSDILRTYQSLHTWTGIVAGLFLFIAFYAGALTMFKPAIEHWATPPGHTLEQVAMHQLDELVQQAWAEYEKPKDGFILNFDQHSSPMQWTESGGGRGVRLHHELRHATLNEAGQLVTQSSDNNALGDLIDRLHRSAGILMPNGNIRIGEYVLGIASALYFLALISGVIFLLPTLVKSLFALRKNKGPARMWLDSHNVIGVVSLPFHLIIAWTAIVFAFHDPFYGGLSVVYGDKPLFESHEHEEVEYHHVDLPDMSHFIAKADELAPGYTLKSLAFTGLNGEHPSLAIEVETAREFMRGGYSNYIYLQPYTMEVEYSSVFIDDSVPYGSIVNSFFGLHFGNYAGDTGRWIYFLLGLVGAFLFYSGNLLWLEKRRQKSSEQTRSSKIMSALTVGVCLGSILGVLVALLSTKWLYLITERVNTHYLVLYYGIFALSIAYAFARGAAVASVHLLYSMAALCAAIPLTTLIAVVTPSIGLWARFDQTAIIIDLLATLFAVTFVLAARKTRQRAIHGDPHSVWSVQTSPVN